MKVKREELIRFLCEAVKNTYTIDKNKMKSTRPESKDFLYEKGELKYIDTYLGEGQFIGEKVVWENNKPIWGLNYTGRILKESFDRDFLREALGQCTEKYPYRGPKLFVRGDYTYKCRVEGEFEWFVGCEKIMYKGIKVYEAMFQGGNLQL